VREAERSYQAALVLWKELAVAYPEQLEFVVGIGGSYGNLGDLVRDRGEPESALTWYDQAVRTLGEVLRHEPRHAQARLFLHNSYAGRADALARLNRLAQADSDWDRAIGLGRGSEGDAIRLARAIAWARAGDHARAVAEADALNHVETIPPGERGYNLACVLALASAAIRADSKLTAADRTVRAKALAARAIEQLGHARTAGWFREPAKVSSLRENSAFIPLRSHRGFQEFLMDVAFPVDPFGPAREQPRSSP
jgi:tetratricopeptide (TPR) repeat protein